MLRHANGAAPGDELGRVDLHIAPGVVALVGARADLAVINQQRRVLAMQEGEQRQQAETKLKEIRELLEVQKSALAQLDAENAATFNVATGPTAAGGIRPSYVALQLKLGLATQDLTDQLRTFFGVPMKLGVLVSTVKAGSIGDASGMKTGDILVELNGVPITNVISYQMALSGISAGKQIKAVVFRDKVRKEIMFEIPDQPHSQLNVHPTSRGAQIANL